VIERYRSDARRCAQKCKLFLGYYSNKFLG
jgi:hypothetical protein